MYDLDAIRNIVNGELGDNVELSLVKEGILVTKKVHTNVDSYALSSGATMKFVRAFDYVSGVIHYNETPELVKSNIYSVIEMIKSEM